MEEQILQKFKLIDREGYINADPLTEGVLKDFFNGDNVEGYMSVCGCLMMDAYELITPEEFEFFEEVFDTPAPSELENKLK